MPDQKPPRLAGGEPEVLKALLQYQRESLVRKVMGIDDGAARQSPVATDTSLLWLVKHLTRAEVMWVLKRFAGMDVEVPTDSVEPSDSVAGAVSEYQETWRRVDAVAFSGASLDERAQVQDATPEVNLRWVVMHLLEETARHAGHADILRELIDGQTGR
jgi:uncharacterized damage-inducible protein DinB